MTHDHDTPTLNTYGQPITAPEYYDGVHVANPMGAGQPPVCSCGWTPHGQFEMSDHLQDMGTQGEPYRLPLERL